MEEGDYAPPELKLAYLSSTKINKISIYIFTLNSDNFFIKKNFLVSFWHRFSREYSFFLNYLFHFFNTTRFFSRLYHISAKICYTRLRLVRQFLHSYEIAYASSRVKYTSRCTSNFQIQTA